MTPRRSGAPLGNTNAYKHGFYSRSIIKKDWADLIHHKFSGLMDEIGIVRLTIRQTYENLTRATDSVAAADHTRTLCLACFCLARLIRTHCLVVPGEDEYPSPGKMLHDALVSLNNENPGFYDSLTVSREPLQPD